MGMLKKGEMVSGKTNMKDRFRDKVMKITVEGARLIAAVRATMEVMATNKRIWGMNPIVDIGVPL